jgi:hypothetical protein
LRKRKPDRTSISFQRAIAYTTYNLAQDTYLNHAPVKEQNEKKNGEGDPHVCGNIMRLRIGPHPFLISTLGIL